MSDAQAQARYAVIFISERGDDLDGYEETDAALLDLVRTQPGYLGVESVSNGSRGITISYWDSLESIRAWRELPDHRRAQQRGRAEWYSRYRIQVCQVQREYSFER